MTHGDELDALLRSDARRWHLLGTVRNLELPDAWIGAGFVRNAVWDHAHARPASPPDGDVDVVWFDPARTGSGKDRQIEACLRKADLETDWSVRNQARMHTRNDDPPYLSTADAIARWPETATAVAVRRTRADKVETCAPFGLDDLFALILRPTPAFAGLRRPVFQARTHARNWLARWPLLRPAE